MHFVSIFGKIYDISCQINHDQIYKLTVSLLNRLSNDIIQLQNISHIACWLYMNSPLYFSQSIIKYLLQSSVGEVKYHNLFIHDLFAQLFQSLSYKNTHNKELDSFFELRPLDNIIFDVKQNIFNECNKYKEEIENKDDKNNIIIGSIMGIVSDNNILLDYALKNIDTHPRIILKSLIHRKYIDNKFVISKELIHNINNLLSDNIKYKYEAEYILEHII
jgi:hypothetical protein